jgi:hypothetical protein
MAGFILLTSCATQTKQAEFDPKTCLEIIPEHVKGLKIIEGPRSEKSIIRDMVFPICNGHVLFGQIRSEGENIQPGIVVFRVVVEYTGEVLAVSVQESTVGSDQFIRKVSDFIMDTDFVGWTRNDTDTVFLYPVHFSG